MTCYMFLMLIKLIVSVSENNEIIYYIHNEELFDFIHKVHLSIGHGWRSRMEHEVNTKYKNITRDMIMLHLNSCESCKRKGSTAKKRISGAINYIYWDKLINNINTCHYSLIYHISLNHIICYLYCPIYEWYFIYCPDNV
jgi:hypothetical protein